MSQIFDALQRSEAERSGQDEAAPRVTDLLERTESHTASGWVAVEAQERRDITDANQSQVIRTLRESPSAAEERVARVSTVVRAADEQIGDPSEFQSLSFTCINDPQSRMVCVPENESPAVEAFHLLGVRLKHLRRGRPLKKILITSTIPQEGKSMAAANLACTLASRSQEKVLLLEGDVRRPTQSRVFGFPKSPGICEWLRGGRSLASSIYALEGVHIWILPAGSASSNSLELLQSGRLSTMMEHLTGWFDWVVIDSPPVLPLADTSVWTNLADGILLVTRQGTTQKKQLVRGMEALGSQKLIGALLNSSKSAANANYYYGSSSKEQSTSALR